MCEFHFLGTAQNVTDKNIPFIFYFIAVKLKSSATFPFHNKSYLCLHCHENSQRPLSSGVQVLQYTVQSSAAMCVMMEYVVVADGSVTSLRPAIVLKLMLE